MWFFCSKSLAIDLLYRDILSDVPAISKGRVPNSELSLDLLWDYLALGPASTMWAGILGYFLAKFSENMVASLLACAS